MNLNQGISTPVAILIIVVLAALVGGIAAWQYKVVKEAETPQAGERELEEGAILQTGLVALEDQPFFQEIQKKVGEGRQSWRLDPIQVAEMKGLRYGFKQTDKFELVNEEVDKDTGAHLAFVVVKHQDQKYIIYLTQPAKTGPEGIWAIYRIERKLAGIPADWKVYRNENFEVRYPRDFSFDGKVLTGSELPGSTIIDFITLPTDSTMTLEQRIQAILQEEGYHVEEFREFKITPKESNWGVDCIKKTTIGGNIPGYFLHLWRQEEKAEQPIGVCWYYGKQSVMLVKVLVMKMGLEYSACLKNQILNQILSTFRFLD